MTDTLIPVYQHPVITYVTSGEEHREGDFVGLLYCNFLLLEQIFTVFLNPLETKM